MNMKPIEDYFGSKAHKPFYMVVGDKEYGEVIDSLKSRAISILHISECCKNIDKLPDLKQPMFHFPTITSLCSDWENTLP